MDWLKKRYVFTIQGIKENRLLFILASPIYILAIVAVQYYIYLGNPLHFFSNFPAWYTVSYTVSTVIISVLLSGLITLIVHKIKEVRYKSMGLGIIGLFFGSIAAGCPGCAFGLFPIVAATLGLGTGLTLAVLPLKGLELQILTMITLIASVLIVGKETELSCKYTKK